jgi:hypothetical protein
MYELEACINAVLVPVYRITGSIAKEGSKMRTTKGPRNNTVARAPSQAYGGLYICQTGPLWRELGIRDNKTSIKVYIVILSVTEDLTMMFGGHCMVLGSVS